jgi:peroxiredoxin
MLFPRESPFRPQVLLLCTLLIGLAWSPGASADTGDHDFELFTLEGSLYALKRVRSRQDARVVVVDFFEVSCIPCRKALPRWSTLHKELKQQGLRMVVVALPGPEDRATAEEKLRKYFRDHPVPFPVVFDKYKNVAKLYGVVKDGSARLPQAFMVHSRGKRIGHGQGPEDLEAKLRQELKKSEP